MKRSSFLIATLVFVLGFTTSSYANVYATNLEVSTNVILTGATNSTVDISFVLNEDADNGVDVKIYSGATLVRTISLVTATKGANSVTWDGTDAGGATLPNGDYTFEVTAADDGYTEWTKISDPLKTVMYSPKGITVNTNPQSVHFGKVYVSNGYAGTSANPGAFYNGDGVFMFNAVQDNLDFSDAGLDWSSSSDAPGESTVGENDKVFVSHTGTDVIYSFDASISTASMTEVLGASNKYVGQGINSHFIYGTGADRVIYTASEAYAAVDGITMYTLGTADALPADYTGEHVVARPNGSYYQNDVVVDSDGNIYICQKRADPGQAYPLLKYPPYTGTTLTLADTLWALPKTVTGATSLLLDEANGHILWGDYYSGNIYVHDMATGAAVDTIITGQNRNNEIVFDAAGNLYSTDNSGEYWNVFSAPDGANEFTTPGLATITIKEPSAVLINEFDTKTSAAEYIELFNNTDQAIDLAADAYVLVFVNGNGDIIYQATDLTGSLPANGFFVLAEAGVTDIGGYTPDQNASWSSIQDGTDGVALVKGAEAGDFANSAVYSISLAAVSGASQQDAVIYAGGDYPDTGLEAEFNRLGSLVLVGSAGSSARVTDGQGLADFANSDWEIAAIRTPGMSNVLPPMMLDAFSYSDTEMDVVYSAELTAVDVADYSLLGTAGVTFASATIDAADAKLVHLVASAGITGDAILDTLVDASLPDTVELYAGITPIAFTNALNPGGTLELGVPATFAGLVTANDAYNNVWVNDGNEAYQGVLIYDFDFDGLVAVGDEIMFTGELDVYNNLSELKNAALLGTASSGNPTFPALITGADIDSSLAADTNPAEQWEGQLVKIEQAEVLSYDATAYTYELTDDGGVTKFLVGDNVDYHLGVVSLTVGTEYDIVGVVDYTAGTYRINPRNMDDVVDLSETPVIVNVMSKSDTEIEVAYSMDLVAADVADYSVLGTAVTFATATLDAVDLTLVHLVASAPITGDGIMDTLIDAANADTVMLYAGVTPIAFTNALNPGGQIEKDIPVTVAGLITADDEYNNVWINDSTGAYNGVLLYDYDLGDTLDVGDEVVLAGDLDIYNNLSELKHIKLIDHLSSDNPTIPTLIDGAAIDSSLAADTNPAEQWEGQLVKIESAMVLSFNASDYRYELTDDDSLTKFLIGDDVDYHFGTISLNVGSKYDIVGVVSYYYGHYIISPRNMDDVIELDITGPELAGIVAVSETELQIRFNEPVVAADATVPTNFRVADDAGAENPTAVTALSETTYLLTVPAIVPNSPYTVTVGGIHDLAGNEIMSGSTIVVTLDVPGSIEGDRIMNDFVAGTGNWQDPNYSGSTYGILDASTFAASSSQAYAGTHSGELVLLDDPAGEGGWFVRLWNLNRADKIQANSKMFFYLRGGNADMQARIVIKDDDAGYDAGPWHDITYAEDDWQVVSIDLENDVLTGWVGGNGVINTASGSVGIDCIQIKCSEDVDATLFIDMVTERDPDYVGTDKFGLPTEFALHDNYPNPFNPITNIRYDIPENTHVTLAIYNIIGQHVIDLVNEDQAAGYYHMQWNGLDMSGAPVSSGLYIYRLSTPENTLSGKMTFLK
ncbi:MAG: T9SS type A sorting domain-containing protein [Candidatus Marinimicrobia bacterium]|nr:T9SS type A sorting domain-containing protein [Candidatus Neomarinimicrobiota bacterium]